MGLVTLISVTVAIAISIFTRKDFLHKSYWIACVSIGIVMMSVILINDFIGRSRSGDVQTDLGLVYLAAGAALYLSGYSIAHFLLVAYSVISGKVSIKAPSSLRAVFLLFWAIWMLMFLYSKYGNVSIGPADVATPRG